MAKDCKEHKKKKLYRRIYAAVVGFIIVVLFVILVIFLVLRPTKPRFSLQDATINQLNVSSPNTINTNLQVTLVSRNPNERIGIYYDRLRVYAAYHDQQITLPTEIPPTYQGHEDVNLWSPFLFGVSVPVSPYLCVALTQDQNIGYIMITIKVDGRLRWKVGTWISGRYHIYVSCPAYVSITSSGMRLRQPSGCSVDV